jgi:hypothetical protein
MLNEFSLREYALNEQRISFMFVGQKCTGVRRSGSFKCSGNCVDRFPTSNEGFESVKKLRQSLWIDPLTLSSEKKLKSIKGLDIRKAALVKLLVSMTVQQDLGELEINYSISGVRVCKNFFYRATGFSKKLFNRAVSFVRFRESDETDTDSYLKLSQKPIFKHICGHLPSIITQPTSNNCKSNNESEELNNCTLTVTSFLDTFFSAHTDVDHVPEEGNVKSVRLNWNRVYDEYVEHCKSILVKPVYYPKFTTIRLVSNSNYL